MRYLARLSLRARLALALVGVAVMAVGFATLLGNLGLEPRLNEAAHARLQHSANHTGDLAARVYRDAGGRWTPSARQTLTHLAALDNLRIEVTMASGRRVPIGPPPVGARASAPIIVAGRGVGTVLVSVGSGQLLTREEAHLQHSLDRLHLAAGAAAIFAALLVAAVLAEMLSRPLRRIRTTAERVGRGELTARVELGGDPEVRSVARALNRLAETLEHEEEIRKASVADLAHELRTPVNGLLTRIEAAQDGVLSGPENLEAMHGEALRLTRLLDDLALLADAERPGLLLDKQQLDLAEVAHRAAESFGPGFAQHNIELETELESVVVLGDDARLGQIAANLLSNALRYTEPGGRVRLSVWQQAGEAVIEVADTGIGIAPEDLKHIFTRFWRGDRSRARSTGGAGIGLAIVRELVRAHDGRIDVDSLPGHGSRFRVTLHAVSPEQRKRRDLQPGGPAQPRRAGRGAIHEDDRPSSQWLRT